MPETYEGKLQLMKLETKLDDHTAQQQVDMSEIKSGLIRIETKLDSKVDHDALDKVSIEVDKKANKDQLDRLDNRFWAVLILTITSLLGLIGVLLKLFIK